MARRGAAAAQCRSLHRVRGADARSQDRRSGAAARLPARLLLYRRARLAKDPRQARRTLAGAGREGFRHRAHPRADRPADRRGVAVGNRGLDHGGNHRAVAVASESKRRSGMKFGPASPAEAVGGVTVHTLRQGSLVLKKGTTIGPAEVEALKKAGVKDIVVVRLEPGDVSEDVAAASIAQAVTDEAITFATLPAFKPVVEGEMVATVKLIPFGVEAELRDAAVAAAGSSAMRVAPY